MSNQNKPEQVEVSNSEPKEKGKKPLFQEILSWIYTLGFAVILALAIRHFIFEPVMVDGMSMADTLQDKEIMYVSKPQYIFGTPKAGDVVICKYPERKENFVKRVIGVPGDEVAILFNQVYINGEPLEEDYLTLDRNNNGFSMVPYKLGEKEYFVMGDNRDNSHDSRNYYGYNKPTAITEDMIKGKVCFVFFPFNDIRMID